MGRRGHRRQRGGGLCRVPACQAGRPRRAAPDPHGPRLRLQPARGLKGVVSPSTRTLRRSPCSRDLARLRMVGLHPGDEQPGHHPGRCPQAARRRCRRADRRGARRRARWIDAAIAQRRRGSPAPHRRVCRGLHFVRGGHLQHRPGRRGGFSRPRTLACRRPRARQSASFNRMLEQVEAANQQLAVALQAQRRFVADASHELRTPLTTIRGNAGLLAYGPDVTDDVRAAAARDIAAESERMSRLVDHLLTLARADAGQHLVLGPAALRPLIESVCRQARTMQPERAFRSVGLTDASVRADEDAMTQLLWILVDNAVKFTRAGGYVELGLRHQDSAALLTVADDGAGVPPGDIDRIFERFYEASDARTNKGAGLGLSIARWIVEEHHGTITARNNDGPGATFTVSLPLAA